MFFLNLFHELLGITNSASEVLQSDTMDLAGAILLIDATVRSLRNSRTEAKR